MLATTLNLAARVNRPSRKPIVLANIVPTQAQADDLFALYARIIAGWIAGKDLIVAEYERTLAGMQHDSADTTRGSIDTVAAEIDRLVIMLTPDLRRWALKVEKVHRGKWVRSVLSATDVNLDTVLTAGDAEDTVGASVNWNIALIKDLSDEMKGRVANAVFTGFTRRAPAPAIAKEIAEATGMARRRARNIASDQTSKLGAGLNEARQKQAGLDSFRWRHSAKLHPRPIHLARDGKIFKWSDPAIANDKPGYAPFCGCTGQGVITFDD